MPAGDDSMHASCVCSSHQALLGISNWLPSIVIQKEPFGLVDDSLLQAARYRHAVKTRLGTRRTWTPLKKERMGCA
jgi:hypothetical protein